MNGTTCKVEIAGALPNVFQRESCAGDLFGRHVRAGLLVCGHDNFEVKLPNFEGLVQPEPARRSSSAGKWKIVGRSPPN